MPVKNLNINCNKDFQIKKKSLHDLVNIVKTKLNKVVDSLELNFVNDKQILIINKKYLGHNFTTDVISFDYSDESNSFDGEIFICTDVALENSKRFKISFDDELKRLVIHGMLHFSGYDDSTPQLRKKMKKIEDELVSISKKIRLL